MAFLVVEGPIGVGKTSLSRMLADALGAQLTLEVVEENPFLAPFYADPERFAFQVQAYFLLSRYRQSQALTQGALFFEHAVSDYLFDKDFIFASMNLRGAEWELYQELYAQLRPRLATPDLTVYLRAEPELLLERIARRGRPFEQAIEADYLRRLGAAYDDYFRHFEGPLHVVEAAGLDFVTDADDRERIVAEVLDRARAA